MKKQEDKHSSRLRPAHSATESGSAEPGFHQDEPRPAIPLNDEQLAFYKERIEQGFYGSVEVRKKIAERLINEVFQRPSKH